jgi:hypothetical protein
MESSFNIPWFNVFLLVTFNISDPKSVIGVLRISISDFPLFNMQIYCFTGFTQPLTQMTTRVRKIMFLGSRALPVGRADNLTSICKLIVWQCGIVNILQPYRSPRPVTRIAFSVVLEAQCYKPEDRGFETRWGNLNVSVYLILPAELEPGVYSASNRNENQKQTDNVPGEQRAAGA